MILTCTNCGQNYQTSELSSLSPACPYCYQPLFVDNENTTTDAKLQEKPTIVSPVFEKGQLVRFVNQQHVWHNEIAIICGIKPLFIRLELHGKRLWVPPEWVTTDGLPELDG